MPRCNRIASIIRSNVEDSMEERIASQSFSFLQVSTLSKEDGVCVSGCIRVRRLYSNWPSPGDFRSSLLKHERSLPDTFLNAPVFTCKDKLECLSLILMEHLSDRGFYSLKRCKNRGRLFMRYVFLFLANA